MTSFRLSLFLATSFAMAQGPVTLPMQTTPSSPLVLGVDLRDIRRYLIHVRMEIPAKPGPLTLVYPNWNQYSHAPRGKVGRLAGLHFVAGGHELPWRRDEVDMFAFHMDVPQGVQKIEATFDCVSGSPTKTFDFRWENALLYPAGQSTDFIRVAPVLRMPATWRFATALETEQTIEGSVHFRTTDLTTLVDSPVVLGQFMHQVDLGTPGGVPHRMNLFADRAEPLQVGDVTISHYKSLVQEVGALFGTRHYTHYDFLISLLEDGSADGYEHHQSTEIRLPQDAFTSANRRTVAYALAAHMLPHEMAHSWNGKYKRPRGLATMDFQEPMKGRLLWVYEGLTEYLGFVLAVRSSILTQEEGRDVFALYSAKENASSGRGWRPLEDTTADPQISDFGDIPWGSYRRMGDYYPEGALLWLEVDSLIRQESHGKRSLDDFCQAFFGGVDSVPAVHPYTYEDLLMALDKVQAHDWRQFFEVRVMGTNSMTPESALTQCGWRLTWVDESSVAEQANDSAWGLTGFDTSFGLGARIQPDGVILDLEYGSPAHQAGLALKMKIAGVNGRQWSIEELKAALKLRQAIDFLVVEDGNLNTYKVNYQKGERHPRLEPIPGAPDLLSPILAAKTR